MGHMIMTDILLQYLPNIMGYHISSFYSLLPVYYNHKKSTVVLGPIFQTENDYYYELV